MSHTPGPWKLHEYYDGSAVAVSPPDMEPWTTWSRRVCDDGGKLLAEVTAHTGNRGWPHVDNGREMEANARLIAAAPELLAALQGVVESNWHNSLCSFVVFGHPCDCGWSAKADAARAAIAKATGKGDKQ